NEANKRSKLDYLLKAIESQDVALVSEAGMPGISDPGFELINGAISRGHRIIAIPGPSMIPTALVVSGLPSHQFTYIGFLPRTRGERRKLLASIAGERRTLVAFEAPHRIERSMGDMLEILGDRRIAVCREMTKVHEEVFRGSVSQAKDRFTLPKGEFTLVIEGAGPGAEFPALEMAVGEVDALCRRGMRLKEAAACVGLRSAISKKKLYEECVSRTARVGA
ncbi:MAG: rRNA small subunit methyltransferase 1, partial [Chloroflexi bacterium]|nr:rRNA small subunit methyltransferase 1 [Chloroflexota bacterium]